MLIDSASAGLDKPAENTRMTHKSRAACSYIDLNQVSPQEFADTGFEYSNLTAIRPWPGIIAAVKKYQGADTCQHCVTFSEYSCRIEQGLLSLSSAFCQHAVVVVVKDWMSMAGHGGNRQGDRTTRIRTQHQTVLSIKFNKIS